MHIFVEVFGKFCGSFVEALWKLATPLAHFAASPTDPNFPRQPLALPTRGRLDGVPLHRGEDVVKGGVHLVHAVRHIRNAKAQGPLRPLGP